MQSLLQPRLKRLNAGVGSSKGGTCRLQLPLPRVRFREGTLGSSQQSSGGLGFAGFLRELP